MNSKIFVYIAVILTAVPAYTLAQDVTTASNDESIIDGPLVTFNIDSFVDTLLVILQSLYYNNNKFELEPQTEAATVLETDLMIQYTGTLAVVPDLVQNRTISEGEEFYDLSIVVPTILVNKTYIVTSVQDPGFASDGYILLTIKDVKMSTSINTAEKPYFVNSVVSDDSGTMTSEVVSQGIPLADEIQETLQELVKTEFVNIDDAVFVNDVYAKLTEIFNNNELILVV